MAIKNKDAIMSEVIVLIGAGSIGQAIARRVTAGKKVVVADLQQGNADAAADVLSNAGFEVRTTTVDVSSREAVQTLVETATTLGDVTGVIHAAGVSPSQASPSTILRVDLYGTAVVLEEFGNVIASGGAGVVIASQSGVGFAAIIGLAKAAFETFFGLIGILSAKTVDDSFAGAILAFGIVYAVASYLLMRGSRAAYVVTVALSTLGLVVAIAYMFRSGGGIFAGTFAIAAFNALVLFLLLGTKSAREFFSRTPATSP